MFLLQHGETKVFPGRAPVLISCGLLLLICSIATADLLSHHRPAFFFPENHASSTYANEDFSSAWDWQAKAFLQDPFGPETLYNLGAIAEQRSGEDASWRELALLSLALDRWLHPNYRPVQDHLNQRYDRDEINRVLQPYKDPAEGVRALRQRVLTMKATPLLPYR